ncbi:hypothetical protein BV20DRAFT_979716 [Pilatotrama ljubarskyi]|nr:hypothetical protein BV20DRAFT_979716 [Pilatotrama ljubarskyi]
MQNTQARKDSPVQYSDDEDVLVSASSKKAPATPGPLRGKQQVPEDELEPPSQCKKGRPSGVQALLDANKQMDWVGNILERGFNLLGATPQSPTRHYSQALSVETSPVHARNAAASAATLEMAHLGDLTQVTKFLCYLENNPAAVITYNTLIKPELAVLRKTYVKDCLRKYEAEEERKMMGI